MEPRTSGLSLNWKSSVFLTSSASATSLSETFFSVSFSSILLNSSSGDGSNFCSVKPTCGGACCCAPPCCGTAMSEAPSGRVGAGGGGGLSEGAGGLALVVLEIKLALLEVVFGGLDDLLDALGLDLHVVAHVTQV